MDPIEFRRPTPEEIVAFLRVSMHSYGADGSDEEMANEVLSNEIDRSFGAYADGDWVGGSGSFGFSLTLPGGEVVPAAGVTMIGVAPTHRRQGILTRMIGQLHADAAGRGEPIAVLTASETSIYRRFGYGMATDVAHLEIAARSVTFDPPLTDDGSFALVDPHLDTAPLAALHDALRRDRPGWLSLSDGMWAQVRNDLAANRHGRTPLRAVVHRDTSGTPDGFATWRIAARQASDRLAGNTLFIEQLAASQPDVEAALWRFLASIDLVTTLEWEAAPPEPAIRWRLVEPRQLKTRARADLVWARLLDVAAVLSRRTYGAAGTLTFDVVDRFQPEVGGRFRLTSPARNAQGECARIEGAAGAADLTVDVADLASLVTGGVTAPVLADAGRLTGAPDAVDTADALFTLARRPWYPIEF